MKILKIDNCTKCNPIGKGVWKEDLYAGTTTESNKIYTGKDKWYCRNKKVKYGGYLGCKYITTAVENCNFITIPSWCPLEDYKEAVK